MANIKVKIKEGAFPVRYKGERFLVGQELTVDEPHFNGAIMERLAVTEEPKKPAARTKKTTESE
ncbi:MULTISPECIES: hypothetical protein [Bacillales]|uniref:Uncharacterized protein n=1 Tax=Lysinibacillus louembei TaxID=1470088 RepID=A0ABZ0RY86_9BACI|nr:MULTISPECIES: hypothetical protein [Bacillales]MCT6924088.1 hypothetical protein [Metasolibacillus sp.]MCT6940195.1 hypothetical protein [Metasolibacillus sp.]WPK12241.1 hypothetical protein R6U77_00720 [Lysinibacillus louembei]